jgi:hypothetical protein
MNGSAALSLALILGLALVENAQAQVKIGVGGPITGPSAATGAQIKKGIDQAATDMMAGIVVPSGWLRSAITAACLDPHEPGTDRRLDPTPIHSSECPKTLALSLDQSLGSRSRGSPVLGQ